MKINITKITEKEIDRSKWIKWKFSDLVENVVEKVTPKKSGLEHYIGLKHLDAGSLKISRFGKTSDIEGDKQKIYKGDFIFAKRNAYLKRIAIADFDAVASAHALVLRAKSESILPEFMPFFLLSELFWQRAIEISVGSLSPTINWKSLAKQEFLLPPKKVQVKLAELFWSMNEVFEKQNIVLDKLKRFDLSQLNHFFYDDPTSEKVKLKDIISIKKGKKPPVLLEKESNGLPYATLKYLRTGKPQYTVPQKYFTKLVKVEQNDLLIVWDGNAAGEIMFAKDGILSSTMCKIEIKDKNYLKDYVFQIIRSKNFYIRNTVIGSAIPHVYPEVFEKIGILKLNINKQEAITKIFREIQKAIITSEIQISEFKVMKKSLINKIFHVF